MATTINLPWDDYNDVELANNELVSLFTMNRCLRRLLDNDTAFKDYISSPLSAINFAADSDMAHDASEDAKATTPSNIAHYLHDSTDGAIKHDVLLADSSIYKAPSIPSVSAYIDSHHTSMIATFAEVSAGTDDTKIVTPLKLNEWSIINYLYVRDEKTATSGGNSTAQTWQTRTLNTEVINTIDFASLSSNKITLPIGTYRISATAPAYKMEQTKIRLRKVSGTPTTIIVGQNCYAEDDYNGAVNCPLIGQFTLTEESDLEIQHIGDLAQTSGFGVSTGFGGEKDIYTQVEIWKVG